MLQALPVTFWLNGLTKNYFTVELNDGIEKEGWEKDNIEKEFKVKYYHENQTSSVNTVCLKTSLNILTSENAVILHHAEVCTPPPNMG